MSESEQKFRRLKKPKNLRTRKSSSPEEKKTKFNNEEDDVEYVFYNKYNNHIVSTICKAKFSKIKVYKYIKNICLFRTRISGIRESQKVRKRLHGMTAVECAVGKDMAREFDQSDEDPFRMKGGGMLRLSDDRKAALIAADIENDIKEQFKKETLLRDEHEEM